MPHEHEHEVMDHKHQASGAAVPVARCSRPGAQPNDTPTPSIEAVASTAPSRTNDGPQQQQQHALACTICGLNQSRGSTKREKQERLHIPDHEPHKRAESDEERRRHEETANTRRLIGPDLSLAIVVIDLPHTQLTHNLEEALRLGRRDTVSKGEGGKTPSCSRV
jgi:hypothetical protein